MTIVLSQRIDYDSSYEDIPFVVYHYPKRYSKQIKTGDIFLYYQGDRYKKENRYYFGFGIIGNIRVSEDGEHFYSDILEGKPFPQRVPIYHPSGGFYESLGYSEVRKKELPAWQNSIRKISQPAFNEILSASGIPSLDQVFNDISSIESEDDPLSILNKLNNRYANCSPQKRAKMIEAHLDRGKSVTDALKRLLGAKCQICNSLGFEKKNGERYIEAHHLTQLALKRENSLCSENVILVCPNCHREIHYGGECEIEEQNTMIHIKLGNKQAIIIKNSIDFLTDKSSSLI